MPAAKQVVYVDVDDEITTIIDKINSADAKVVALVLPKRAAVFQSIVNMKLLKRKAEQASRHLVLITSEASLMPLAGLAGVYVAPTLQSKPEVPTAPAADDELDAVTEEAISMDGGDKDRTADFDASGNARTPVGALAGTAGDSVKNLPDDMVELDNAAPSGKPGGKPSPQMAAMAAGGKSAKGPKDKKLQVPNFFRFRKRLILGALGLILLGVLYYIGWYVMPTAAVTIKTKTSDISSSIDMTLNTEADAVNAVDFTLPAKLEQQQKNNTQQSPATGSENRGEKATGEVTLSLADCSQESVSIPAGTGLSSNGMTFITQSSVTLNSVKIGPNCRNSDFPNVSSGDTAVVAQRGGANYNIGPSSFSGAPAGVRASSSEAMSGGTDNIIKLVQQADIDAAKAKMASNSEKDSVKAQLQRSLEDKGLYALPATFHVAGGDVTTSSKVGDQAEAVTVSQTITYSMYGAKKTDLRKLVEASADDKIDKKRQSLIDDGIDKGRFTVLEPGAGPQLRLTMNVTAVAGPQLDADKIKLGMAGKKSGQVRDEIKANPGVEDATVKYSPFWVESAPKPDKITVVFEKTGEAVRQSSDKTGGDKADDAQ